DTLGAPLAPPVDVAGHVVKGAMAQERLSSESLGNISAGIRNFTAQGGGEIRLRLKPDNLGELHVRVVTQGNDVGLRIQASSERAKRVLEESISHLRDSLASQRLNLGAVDFTVGLGAQSGTSNSGSDSRSDQNQWQGMGQHSFQDTMGQN